jgi:hypothetical protein
MAQHDAAPREVDPEAGVGDDSPVTDEPQRRTASRRMLVWLALPVAIAFGAGGGYLAAERWTPADRPPAAAAGHSSHQASTTHTDDTHAAGGHGGHAAADADEHGAAGQHEQHQDGAGHDTASVPAAADGGTGHDAGGSHDSSGGHEEPSAVTRPRTAVLTGFATVNAAILLVAAVLRRRPRPTRRTAARTA